MTELQRYAESVTYCAYANRDQSTSPPFTADTLGAQLDTDGRQLDAVTVG